jgi:hypothetical protein
MWNAMGIDQKDRTVPAVSRTSGFRKGHWIAIVLLTGTTYLAYPYYCLYRIDQAIQSGSRSDLTLYLDAERFEGSVREEFGNAVMLSLLAALMEEAGPGQAPDLAIPYVLSRMQAVLASDSSDGLAYDVRYAFFETPTVFRVDLGTPGSPREDWVTVRLRLAEWVWKLSELRLPT